MTNTHREGTSSVHGSENFHTNPPPRCPCARLATRPRPAPWDPRTVACQAPLSIGCSKQNYWRRLPFPTPGNPPHPGIETASPVSLALAGRFCATVPPGKRSRRGRFQSWPVSPALATLLCFPLQRLMSSLQLKEYSLSINSCKHKARDCDAKLTKYAPCFQGVQDGVRKIKIILKLLYCDDIRH